jgi:hypothetical protein
MPSGFPVLKTNTPALPTLTQPKIRMKTAASVMRLRTHAPDFFFPPQSFGYRFSLTCGEPAWHSDLSTLDRERARRTTFVFMTGLLFEQGSGISIIKDGCDQQRSYCLPREETADSPRESPGKAAGVMGKMKRKMALGSRPCCVIILTLREYTPSQRVLQRVFLNGANYERNQMWALI